MQESLRRSGGGGFTGPPSHREPMSGPGSPIGPAGRTRPRSALAFGNAAGAMRSRGRPRRPLSSKPRAGQVPGASQASTDAAQSDGLRSPVAPSSYAGSSSANSPALAGWATTQETALDVLEREARDGAGQGSFGRAQRLDGLLQPRSPRVHSARAPTHADNRHSEQQRRASQRPQSARPGSVSSAGASAAVARRPRPASACEFSRNSPQQPGAHDAVPAVAMPVSAWSSEVSAKSGAGRGEQPRLRESARLRGLASADTADLASSAHSSPAAAAATGGQQRGITGEPEIVPHVPLGRVQAVDHIANFHGTHLRNPIAKRLVPEYSFHDSGKVPWAVNAECMLFNSAHKPLITAITCPWKDETERHPRGGPWNHRRRGTAPFGVLTGT
eukprot:TRINITY_DN24278_c0_g1_i1.p1 TRINITY_DN24278_c0_g1~~TRINITY_DN24278_c0_g1_i1.p1  ORF type:complete len:388 (-),score=57.61 TRINITY_DN24278_c0_g1_i1:115-1278(-)